MVIVHASSGVVDHVVAVVVAGVDVVLVVVVVLGVIVLIAALVGVVRFCYCCSC